MRKTLGFIFGLAALSTSGLLAQEIALDFEPSKAEVTWSLIGNVHTVHGSFKLKRGAVHFDPTTGKAGGELVVDILSGESGNGSRDKKMQKDVLESQKWSEAVFLPDRLEGKPAEGDSKVSLHGIFKLHGADHELTLDADVHKQGGQYVTTTHFVVPYVKWGMKNPSFFAFRVEDTVKVEIKAEAHSK